MSSVSLVTGHIEEPENGVYCSQCEHAVFGDTGAYFGFCKLSRMIVITPISYCAEGGVEKITKEE